MTDPLWITYSWADNDEGDFDFLVQELGRAGIPSLYDKIALVPGRKLWAQIAGKITDEPLSAWAYLVTPQSLRSSACQEELAYALQRALDVKGDEFPVIGLLHKVSIRDVPTALRVRLCVNLGNPDWIEEIRAGVEGVPPRRTAIPQLPYIVKVHRDYLGRKNQNAIEVRPRFGELAYWRLAFPSDGPQPVRWGAGPADGGATAAVMLSTMTGEYQDIQGVSMRFVGAGNQLSPSTSAYAVFSGDLPDRFFFGTSKEPFAAQAEGVVVEVQPGGHSRGLEEKRSS